MKADLSTDEKLILAYRAGDKKALALLVKKWHKLFCDKAYWLVKDKDLAKDIAQDSWTVIINKLDRLKEPKQFKYWAYRIVCNKAMDCLRLKANAQKKVVNYNIDIKSDDKSYSENELLKQQLLNAITKLPKHQKEILNLFYTESYSLKQISVLLKISVGTAKSRLFHAREKLKKTLKHRNYEN